MSSLLQIPLYDAGQCDNYLIADSSFYSVSKLITSTIQSPIVIFLFHPDFVKC